MGNEVSRVPGVAPAFRPDAENQGPDARATPIVDVYFYYTRCVSRRPLVACLTSAVRLSRDSVATP